MRSLRGIAILFVGAFIGCAPSRSADTDELAMYSRDPHVLTAADLAVGGPRNLLNAIRDLRPRWLQTPGSAFSTITVFVGDNRGGGVGSLDALETSAVRTVRYFETSAAQQRFSGVSGPVIQVFLR
jgi:hypothetical protein